MSLELRSYGLRSERLDSDTAGLGVVDGGRCIRVDDVRVGLGVVDAVPGLGVEVVGEADPDAAASGTEPTSGVLETEGRDEEQTQLLEEAHLHEVGILWGRTLGFLNGIISAIFCINNHLIYMLIIFMININTTSTLCHPISLAISSTRQFVGE